MSIQQRLLQREPLDPWSIREQLCLASAVCRSGDQNWMSVSRAMRAAGDPTRPQDWYQQKYCAAQYGALLESAETPKRKKRTSEGAAESPQEAILKRLTAERIAELQKLMQDHKTQYAIVKEEVSEILDPATSDSRLRELLAGVEAARRLRDREQQRQAQWLRDREQRRRSADKSRRVSLTAPGMGLSPPASSPLLSSLLNNTSPPAGTPSVTQILHIPHPSHIQDTTSPSASAPTLSQLLEKGRPPAPAKTPTASDAAVIEQIKSELQEIENNLRLGTMPPSTPTVLPPALSLPGAVQPHERSLDIDDIEIKAEDVYAFSDMDFEMQPVSSIHKAALTSRSIDKAVSGREESEPPEIIDAETVDIEPEEMEIKQELLEAVTETEDAENVRQVPETAEVAEVTLEPADETAEAPEDPAPDPPDEILDAAEPNLEKEADIERETQLEQSVTALEETVDPEEESSKLAEDDEDEEVNVTALSDAPEETIDNIQLHIEGGDETAEEHNESAEEESVVAASLQSQLEDEQPSERESELEPDREEVEEKTDEPVDMGGLTIPAEPPAKPSDAEPHAETDDDTPMQVIREEEKLGRKRRDYSRRKTQILSESRGASGSESAAESAPASPRAAPTPEPRADPAPESCAVPTPEPRAAPTPEPDKDHRLWKKSVMLVYNRLCAHKYASLFLRPITDDVAPDYSLVVKRPMDLTTIKRNIDSGVIRTTAEFQRDILLMLSNALFYNSSRHRVHQMAQEMHQEAVAQLGMLLQAQAHAALADSHAEPPARRPHPPAKRKRLSSPHALPASPAAKRVKEE